MEQPLQAQRDQPRFKSYPDICLFGIRIIARQNHILLKELPGIIEKGDIESIHRMRVASRRMRTALGIFADCLPGRKGPSWTNHIRQLTRSLGEARDTDVQLQLLQTILNEPLDKTLLPGMKRLLLRFQQKRSRLQLNVLDTLSKLQKSSTLDQIDVFTRQFSSLNNIGDESPLLELAYKSISSRLDEFLFFEVYIDRPEYEEELHQMRIAAKRLRYTLEIFSPLFPDHLKQTISATRKTQDLLGEIHDCDVWIMMLPEFEMKERKRVDDFFGHARPYLRLRPGIEFFLNDRRIKRHSLYNTFLKDWEKWRSANLWLELKRTCLAAIPPAQEIEPPKNQ